MILGHGKSAWIEDDFIPLLHYAANSNQWWQQKQSIIFLR